MEKTVTINGNTNVLPQKVENIQHLLEHLQLSQKTLVVEVNKEIVMQEMYNQPIRNRDQIEIIHFVGGG